MNIPPNEFRWYAAFHDEGDHPHVHMMAWSAGDAPGYLSPVGIEKIKSMLTNDIFRQEMLHVYKQKSQSRDELVAEARRAIPHAQLGDVVRIEIKPKSLGRIAAQTARWPYPMI